MKFRPDRITSVKHTNKSFWILSARKINKPIGKHSEDDY